MRRAPAWSVILVLIIGGIALLCAGCVDSQTRQDTAVSAATIYNAAASNGVPAAQADAIEKNAASIAAAMGHPLIMTTTGAAIQ